MLSINHFIDITNTTLGTTFIINPRLVKEIKYHWEYDVYNNKSQKITIVRDTQEDCEKEVVRYILSALYYKK